MLDGNFFDGECISSRARCEHNFVRIEKSRRKITLRRKLRSHRLLLDVLFRKATVNERMDRTKGWKGFKVVMCGQHQELKSVEEHLCKVNVQIHFTC